MKLATLVREMKMPSPSPFENRLYILTDYYKMAMANGFELVGIMSGMDYEAICTQCDGLLIPGSAKNVDPKYYGGTPLDPPQEIDEYAIDRKVMDVFVKQGKPIFGICGGLQELNVYFGGDLTQIDYPPHQNEEKYHTITVEKDSFVYDVFGTEEAWVNSHHHWCIKNLAPNFKVVARCKSDGVIEAIEDTERGIFATQWHPELSFHMGDPIENNFFKNFVERCKNAK